MGGRARAELAAKKNPQLEDRSWMKFAGCEYCGRQICVNNYSDRRARTPKFLGLVICPWCDPREPHSRWVWRNDTSGPRPPILNLVLYRTIISTWLVRALMKGVSSDKVLAQAAKFWDEEGGVLQS